MQKTLYPSPRCWITSSIMLRSSIDSPRWRIAGFLIPMKPMSEWEGGSDRKYTLDVIAKSLTVAQWRKRGQGDEVMFVVVHSPMEILRKVDALSRPERCLGFLIPLPNFWGWASVSAPSRNMTTRWTCGLPRCTVLVWEKIRIGASDRTLWR